MFKGGGGRRVFNEEKVSFSELTLQSDNPVYLRDCSYEHNPKSPDARVSLWMILFPIK